VAKKLYYKIGEACKLLDIQPYVLRYWETEFTSLSPSKSKSGQRTYTEEDLRVIGRIKELLYEEGFTIAGAKKRLEGELQGGGLKPLRPIDLSGKKPAKPKAAPAKPEKAAQEEDKPETQKSEVQKSAATEAEDAEPKAGEAKSKRVEELEAGIEGALGQAREILALLEPGSKKR
jgi:DNA-binding transcriptional MerR regulator